MNNVCNREVNWPQVRIVAKIQLKYLRNKRSDKIILTQNELTKLTSDQGF